jgi:hypothetical protein
MKTEDMLQAMFDHRRLAQIEDYVRRGRMWGEAELEVLRPMWVAAYHVWADDPGDKAKMRLVEDFEAEFELRGEKTPDERIAGLQESLRKQIEAVKDDPTLIAELAKGIKEEWASFVAATEQGAKRPN